MTGRLYTIPPDTAFIEALAEGLLQRSDGDMLALSEGLILLPTRRACRHLREAFLRHMDKDAGLLPRMQPLGDMDEDEFYFESAGDFDPDLPPSISPLRRQLLLTQLIRKKDAAMPLDQAAQLADALGRFLDQVQTEECSFDRLAGLVQEQDLAIHWQQTVEFLTILTASWPSLLAEEGCIDPADRRRRLLHRQAALWRQTPPDYPVIAAGSTGSMKATADLLKTIASMPGGCVVLPGLDQILDETAWQSIGETHPQFGMKELLEKCGLKRREVALWPTAKSPSARVRLLQESMRPAEVTEAWRELLPENIPPQAFKGLTRLDLDHPQQEAQAIALCLRNVLETPGRKAMLVTPDRDLAERVRLMLVRWGIEANDSGGVSLATQPVGAFLMAALEASDPEAGAVNCLSLFKHPLTACGMEPPACRHKIRQIEMEIRGFARAGYKEAFGFLQSFLQPLARLWNRKASLSEWIRTHIEVVENLAASDVSSGMERLWHGEAGETAAEWLNDWQNAASGFPLLNGEEYTALLSGLLQAVTVRPTFGQHPRLSILGPLEARLIHADLVIIGGLNEGVWPPEAVVDPWMSRPMKRNFGLSLPERRVGLAAHDFVQLASAREVILTRAKRTGNAPTVPSRFLLQLDTVLQALGYSNDKKDALASTSRWAEWAHQLDAPEPSSIKPCDAPQPCPPLESRPRQLSVTEIGTWRRNPYAIYARHVLKLRKLEDLDAEIDAADRGTIIHDILERFIRKYPDHVPPHALDELSSMGREAFALYQAHPEVKAFWWPRFERIAVWLLAMQTRRYAEGTVVAEVEASGQYVLDGFTLKGRADRVDRMKDASLEIIDYKTGFVPTEKSVIEGYEPQLALLALIAERGGFANLPASPVSALSYWELRGRRAADQVHAQTKKPVSDMIVAAEDGLRRLIAAFSDPGTPYIAVPRLRLQPKYDDYAHLARLAEWGRTESEE